MLKHESICDGVNFMNETDLYFPIKLYLESLGFYVQGEVGAIDVFAMKGENSVAIELKKQITLKLIYQAIDCQKIADEVFIAVPKSAMKSHRTSMKSFLSLLKRLSIGLLVVDHDHVQLMLDIQDYNNKINQKRYTKKRNKILSEFKNREQDLNTGGSKGKRMTVYREKSIKVALMIEQYQVLSPKMIKELINIEETSSILQKNYYSWFIRIRRGLYTLSDEAKIYLEKYKEEI